MKVKLKGAYEHDLEGQELWHKDFSMLVVPKVAEQVIVYDKPIRDTVINWPHRNDFMMRVKVPRSSRLVLEYEFGNTAPLENTQRYYVSTTGGELFKIMPPTKLKPDKWRRIAVCKGWKVCPCNDIKQATAAINYEFYIQEVEKLVLGIS